MPDTMPRRPLLTRAAAAACALPPTTLADCRPLHVAQPPPAVGAVEEIVTWKAGGTLAPLAPKPVRLRFARENAHLFSFQFIQ